DGPFARGSSTGTVSGNETRDRAADRDWFLLRFSARCQVHSRGPRTDRSQDGGNSEEESALRAQADAQRRGSSKIRRRLDEERADRGTCWRDLLRIHARSQFHRFLPRSARAVNGKAKGVQAALHRRRLLERQRKESAASAHLRHSIL